MKLLLSIKFLFVLLLGLGLSACEGVPVPTPPPSATPAPPTPTATHVVKALDNYITVGYVFYPQDAEPVHDTQFFTDVDTSKVSTLMSIPCQATGLLVVTSYKVNHELVDDAGNTATTEPYMHNGAEVFGYTLTCERGGYLVVKVKP